MDTSAIRRLYRATAYITVVAFVFWLFFAINKKGPLGEINPFAVDPYDAVGSFAFQIAALLGVLNFARVLRLRMDAGQDGKARLVERGNALVLAAVAVTLAADVVAELRNPFAASYGGTVLLIELAGMIVIALAAVAAHVYALRGVQLPDVPRDLTPADGIDDLWTLARAVASVAAPLLPRLVVEWIHRFNSDRLFARLPWVDPRRHSWRFAAALGLLVGIGVLAAQFSEGLPPSAAVALLVAAIFIGAEFAATLLGFALLGGWLGLRPAR